MRVIVTSKTLLRRKKSKRRARSTRHATAICI